MLQIPLPNIQTKASITLVSPAPPSSLAGLLWNHCCFSDDHTMLLLLHCHAPLAPSGVSLPMTAGAFCSLGNPLLRLPSFLLVLSCLAPPWSFYAHWSCSAWLLFGPPTPTGPVLPGSTLVLPRPLVLFCLAPFWCSPLLHAGPAIFLITKSISPLNNTVHSTPKKGLLSSLTK